MECPFEAIGCMFDHSFSKNCKFGSKCEKALCSFQHNNNETEKLNNAWKCDFCDFNDETEAGLVKHMNETHEWWKTTEKFCDNFCKANAGIHICMCRADFYQYIGFDIKNTFDTDEVENIFRCSKCDETNDDDDIMRNHIEEKHGLDIKSKCHFCGFEDNTFVGLRNHFNMNHMEED